MRATTSPPLMPGAFAAREAEVPPSTALRTGFATRPENPAAPQDERRNSIKATIQPPTLRRRHFSRYCLTVRPLSLTYITAGLLSLVCLVAPACSKNDGWFAPRNRGVFYQQADGKLVLLFSGTAIEMAPRAVSVTGTRRPTFVVDLSNLLLQGHQGHQEDGPSRGAHRGGADRQQTWRVPARRRDGHPGQGKPGAFQVRPTADLPAGLGAIVLGADETLTADKDNVYPFNVTAERSPG